MSDSATLVERLRVAINVVGYVTLAESRESLARIAELEAERDKWHGDAVTQMRHKIRLEDELAGAAIATAHAQQGQQALFARIAELEAELKETHIEAGAWQTQVRAAVLAEREACAVIADGWWQPSLAATIRARPAP